MPDADFDIKEFLRLAERHTEENKNRLATVFADLIEDKSLVLSDREKDLMFKITETLLHEVEASLCHNLGRALAQRNDVPRDLITYLANREASVAAPVLSYSELLSDADLLEIIRQRTTEHQMAITLRRRISEDVSGALVEAGDEDVIVSLLRNPNSEISETTLEYLVEQSKRVDTFQDPLVRREDLSDTLAARLYKIVSDVLKQDLASKFDFAPEILDEVGSETNTPQTSKKTPSNDATDKLIRQLHDKGMVTHEAMLAALNQGEIPLFVGLFAELTHLDAPFVKSIIFEGNGEETAVACRAMEASENEFLTIIEKTRYRKNGPQANMMYLNNSRLLTFYRAMSPDKARNALDAWKEMRGA